MIIHKSANHQQTKKQKEKKMTTLNSLEKKLLSYSIAAGAAITAVGTAEAVQYIDLNDIMVSQDTLNLDFNEDGQIDFIITHSGGSFSGNGYSIRFSGASARGVNNNNRFVGGGFSFNILNEGDVIENNNDFIRRGLFASQYYYNGSPSGYPGKFGGAQKAFFGVKFSDTNGNTLFGWGRVSVPDDNSKITFHDVGFNDVPGAAIQAGEGIPSSSTPIPEPGTLGMLALGAVGVVAWRKRKENKH